MTLVLGHGVKDWTTSPGVPQQQPPGFLRAGRGLVYGLGLDSGVDLCRFAHRQKQLQFDILGKKSGATSSVSLWKPCAADLDWNCKSPRQIGNLPVWLFGFTLFYLIKKLFCLWNESAVVGRSLIEYQAKPYHDHERTIPYHTIL